MADPEIVNTHVEAQLAVVECLPAGPIPLMSPEEQDQIGRAIASAIVAEVIDGGPSPIDPVCDAVSERLGISSNDMLYGLLYGEDKEIVQIDHRHLTVAAVGNMTSK